LDPIVLDMQQSLFVLTMKNNSKGTRAKPHSLNPFTHLWRQLTTFKIVVQKMLEYIKLPKITIVQVLDFAEDEWCFNILSFMKNLLTTHLDVGIQLFVQKFYTLESFFMIKLLRS
jgi:hypothetical protein